MKPTISVTDLVEAIRQHGRATAHRPEGKGWFTLSELGERLGISKAAATKRLEVTRANGVKVERANGTIITADGNPTKAVFFRLQSLPTPSPRKGAV